MPVSHEFEYFKPQTLDEVIELLSKYEGKASVLAGGTDLAVHIKEDIAAPDAVIDIKRIGDFNRFELEGERLFIGAAVTFTDLIESDLICAHLPLIWEASKTVASVGIRNRATLVGNICSAVPSADGAPALLCYDAEIIVKSKDGERVILISDWFTGPKQTSLNSDEIVIGVSIPLINKKHAAGYEKFGRYDGEDLAQSGVGILITEDLEYRIAFCAVGPVPSRSKTIEEYLSGKEIDNEILKKVKNMVPNEISPITDIRSTKEYRTLMTQTMLVRGLKRVTSILKGGGHA